MNGASSPPLLYAECASPLETGLFPVHAHWCPRGSRKGAMRERVPPKARAAGPAVRTRTAPARRLTGQDAGPYNPQKRRGPKEDKAATRSRRAPDPPGERVRPPDSAPYLNPSFQNTARRNADLYSETFDSPKLNCMNVQNILLCSSEVNIKK